jgi:hypothetical protein
MKIKYFIYVSIKGIGRRFLVVKNKIILVGAVLLLCLSNTVKAEEESVYEWHSKTNEYNVGFETMVKAVTSYQDYAQVLPNVDLAKIDSIRGYDSICYFESHMIVGDFALKLKFKAIENTENKLVIKTTYLKGNVIPFESITIVERVSLTKTSVTAKLRITEKLPGITLIIPDSAINQQINGFLYNSLNNIDKYLKARNNT